MRMVPMILAIGILTALTACPSTGGTTTTVGSGGGVKAKDGGSASSSDQKSKLVIPKNGLSKDATVTIAASTSTGTIPSGQAIVPGSTIAISASDGATLSNGTLTLTFDPAKIVPLSGNLKAKADSSGLRLYQLVAGGWKIVNGIPTINQTTLTQIINEFGLYALFATPALSGDSVNFDQLSSDANPNTTAFKKPSFIGITKPGGALSKLRFAGVPNQDTFLATLLSDDGGYNASNNRYDFRKLQLSFTDVGDGIVTGKDYTVVAGKQVNGQANVGFFDWYDTSGPGTPDKTVHEWVASSGTIRVKAYSATRVDLEIINVVFTPKDIGVNTATNEAKGSFRVNTTLTNITPILQYTNGVLDK